jgi:hypothetical protein
MRNRTTSVTLFQCTNCLNRNKVTVKARWTRWSIALAVTASLGLTLGASALAITFL